MGVFSLFYLVLSNIIMNFNITIFNTTIFNTTNFMHINNGCLMDSDLNFSCIYITQLIWLDPFMNYDVKYICNQCKKKNFTNNQLAEFINKRFNNTLLSNCTVNVISGYEEIQLIDQCKYLYNNTC